MYGVWHYDNKGSYTVRSGYKLLCTLEQADSLESTTPFEADNRMVWKSVWTAEVPNKIKVLIGRIYHGALTVMVNLEKRKLNVDKLCFLCREAADTVLHAIRDCSCASRV